MRSQLCGRDHTEKVGDRKSAVFLCATRAGWQSRPLQKKASFVEFETETTTSQHTHEHMNTRSTQNHLQSHHILGWRKVADWTGVFVHADM